MQGSDTSTFGELLRRFRYATGYSQEYLAERAYMSAVAVGALERGVRRAPHRETVDLLAKALALSEHQRAALETAADRGRARKSREGKAAVELREIALQSKGSHLPSPTATFLGREREKAILRDLLTTAGDRIVTLTGPGGVGKSRLAVETVRDLREEFANGMWLVELAAISDENKAVQTVASALGVVERANRPTIESLLRAIRERDLLIVLDNCEHVIRAVASLASAIASECPRVRLLSTSREPLHIADERTLALRPLAYPAAALTANEEASSYAAIELFVRLASRQSAESYTINPQNVAPICEIVRRLDGLPLAIELAVPSLRVLSAAALAQHLRDCLEFPVGGDRKAHSRHRTLHGLIDWSYKRLTEGERFVFRSCSAFAGHFDMPAVVAICAGMDYDKNAILSHFSSLVDKSLIVVAGQEVRRYSLLESSREYTRHLPEVATARRSLRRAHAEHYVDVARGIHDSRSSTSHENIMLRLRAERNNFDAALDWSLVEHNDAELGGTLVTLLTDLFESDSVSNGRRWFEVALAALDPDAAKLLYALLTLGLEAFSRYGERPPDRVQNIERAVSTFRDVGDTSKICFALCMLAHARAAAGDLAGAETAGSDAAALARGALRPSQLMWVLSNAAAALLEERLPLQIALIREGLDACRDQNDALVSFAMLALGESEFFLGEFTEATQHTLQAIEILEASPSIGKPDLTLAYAKLGVYYLAVEDFDAACKSARDGLRLSLTIDDPVLTALVIQSLALASARVGDLQRAARLAGYCFARTGPLNPLMRAENYCRRNLTAILDGDPGSAHVETLRLQGSTWSEDAAVAEALLV